MTDGGPVDLQLVAPPGLPGAGVFAGRYRAHRLLKRGHGIETLLGTDLVERRTVVIKTASSDSLSPGAHLRLEHEAGVLRQLRSPWVAPLLDFGREGDLLYLVMPFVPGVTLEKRLAHGPLSVRDTVTVGRCLMSALQAIHEHGVCHRDLKPANLIVDEGTPLERATVIDFGLARSARLDASIRDQPVGTARYLSPEQAGLLDCQADQRSDLYAAGVVLFECLAGRPPFVGDSVGEVLRQHVTVRPPDLRGLHLAVPRALDEVIQRLLRKDPRDRYQSAEAALADLFLIADTLDRGVAEPPVVVGLHDRRRTLTEPAFVGRQKELAALDEQLAQARRGVGGLIVLEAESGGGKSRLLDELALRGGRHGAWVFRGQGADQVAKRPFQVLVGVAAELLATEGGSTAAIRARLGEQAQAVCAALPELAGVLGAGAPERLGPETFGQFRSLQALTALLDALGAPDRPALVLLDDCQWADELTFKLLRHWQRRADPGGPPRHVLVVVAFRSEDVPAGHRLRALRPALHLRLAPFAAEDVRQLAESMAGPLPPAALTVVERLSEGVPFLAAAVLQGLVESAALVPVEPAGWQVEPLALADVQSSRHAATFLARRIDRLPADVRALLSAGAVLGKEFDPDAAAALAGQTPLQADAALEEARRRHLVWASGPDAPCTFLHDKLRQTLLERLAPAALQDLHGRAAQYLEQRHPERVFDLAYHFDAAGASARALPYALAAAEQARARHALEIAEQQYRIARRGLREADRAGRFQVAEGLGDVLMLRGRYDDAAPEFETALALADGDLARARVEGKRGELAFKRGDVKTAGERVEGALRLLGKRVPRRFATFLLLGLWEVFVQAWHTLLPWLFVGRRRLTGAETELVALRLYSRLAHLYWFHRGTVPALWAHLHELNVAERYPPTPELAQAYSEHAPGMSLLGYFRRGIAYVEKSLAVRRALGDLWGQGQSLHFYGIVLYASARFRESVERCREAVRLLERTGDYWEMHIARYQIAASLYRLGDLRGAVAEAQRLYQSGLELGDAQATGISLDVWARAALGRVPAEIVRAELERPSDDVQRTAQVLAAEGVRLLAEDRPEPAAEVLVRALQLLQRAGVKNAWVAPVWPWLATALRRHAEKAATLTPGRRRDLLRQAQAAARRARRLARTFPNELPHALRESGWVCALQGRVRPARRYFDRSLAAAERQGARYEHAQTLLARGQVGLEADWPGAAEAVAAAQQALRALEAPVSVRDDGASGPAGRPATLSLADRFDTVLDAGRRIASALSRDAIFAAVREAALKLLRAERCLLLKVQGEPGAEEVTAVSGEVADQYSRALVRRAVATGRAVAVVEGVAGGASESVLLSGARSVLCAPVFVRGRPVGCFYVIHRQVGGLFGPDEERLADFIAALAGAALENAEGFAELRRLNEALRLQIEERRHAEKQVREQAALLDKARDAISVRDFDDRILYWNHSAARLYGWTAEEALGRKAGELLFREPPPAQEAARRAVLEHGEWTGELRQLTRAGKEIIVESRWTLVRDAAGRPQAFLVVSTDVTEKRKLEAQFLRAQRMESIGKLAGGIAHDINNVLTPILMSIDLLRRRDLPEEQRLGLLAGMEASAERGADMVKQILSFARGVEGQRILLQPRHVAREIEKMLGRTFPKSIDLVTSLPRDLWLVNGDATQLYQMLMNLCVNARDAMAQGGRLEITAANRVLGDADARLHPDARPGPYVVLTVADTGTGVAPDVLDQIFDPFFTTKEFGKGTGLGLSTVLGIVKGHGGFIQVTSEVGVGTQFQVYLPAAETAPPKPAEEAPAPLPLGKGELVLVVDDEAAIRDVTRRNLETFGYRVLTAKDGTEAVALYRQHRSEVRAVLTDLMMPGMDGRATIRALRELDPDVRVIVMSGLALGGDIGPADLGARAFLLKPYEAAGLLRTLRDVIGA
jgi:PAS domain S-box-containing protein